MPGWPHRGAGKKLKRVAAAWATGGRSIGRGAQADPDDPFAAAIAERLAARTRGTGDQVIEIAPDEADPVALFFALQTQWRRHAMTGAAIGLDYAAVEPTARMTAIDVTPATFADLRVMEAAALDALLKI